jgi:hypothetical protein
MIRLTAKGLARYMTSGAAAQRKILWNYKHPDPEGAVQAKYYAEARHAIERFHKTGNDASVVVQVVEVLHSKALRVAGRKQDRIKNNIRALENYLSHFAKSKLTILPSPDLKFVHGQVAISAFPDLYVLKNSRHTILKMDFSRQDVDLRVIKIVLQITFLAAQTLKLPVSPKDVIYVDVVSGTEHRGARLRTRLVRDIEATCQIIEDVWPKL